MVLHLRAFGSQMATQSSMTTDADFERPPRDTVADLFAAKGVTVINYDGLP